MNSQKFFFGGIVGGIVFFLLGYLVYGLLLKDYFDAHHSAGAVDMSKMIWWALILGNLFSGFLMAYVLGKAKVSSAGGGAGVGFTFGLLMALSVELISHAIGRGMKDITGMAVHIIVYAVMSAIAGAIVGWVMGMGANKTAAS
jgi:membrane protein YqaA with SNARE-associated domain